MKSYILKGIDDALRQRLFHAGVLFYEWGNDIACDQSQLELALETLDATATEKPTEYENMFELQLTYGRSIEHPRTPQVVLTEPRAIAREAYIKVSSARLKDAVNSHASFADGKVKTFNTAYAAFLSRARRHHASTDGGSESKRRERLKEEFARICDTGKVIAARVVKGTLYVYTDTLTATSPDGKNVHQIGKFLITIRLDAEADPIRWFNQTRISNGVRNGMHAPYVFSDGSACVAEIQETLAELVATFDLAVAVELAIQFIETVNEDEAGRYLGRWPIISSKKA